MLGGDVDHGRHDTSALNLGELFVLVGALPAFREVPSAGAVAGGPVGAWMFYALAVGLTLIESRR